MNAIEAYPVAADEQVIEWICADCLFEDENEYYDRIAPDVDWAHLGDIAL